MLGIFINLWMRCRGGGGTGSGVSNLLLETGDNFLLESGTTDVLILEP